MNDRDLLELAAKAIGKEYGSGSWRTVLPDGTLVIYADRMGGSADDETWNPLKYDGDALRLAVKLGLQVTPEPEIGCATAGFPDEWWKEERIQDGGSIHAATRRAIVRAAAEIGKGMKDD